jgi:hypothetical protein
LRKQKRFFGVVSLPYAFDFAAQLVGDRSALYKLNLFFTIAIIGGDSDEKVLTSA